VLRPFSSHLTPSRKQLAHLAVFLRHE
jgi:hypothetical protein